MAKKKNTGEDRAATIKKLKKHGLSEEYIQQLELADISDYDLFEIEFLLRDNKGAVSGDQFFEIVDKVLPQGKALKLRDAASGDPHGLGDLDGDYEYDYDKQVYRDKTTGKIVTRDEITEKTGGRLGPGGGGEFPGWGVDWRKSGESIIESLDQEPQRGGGYGGGYGGGKKAAPAKTQEIPNPYLDLPKSELEWRLKNATTKEEAQKWGDALKAKMAQEVEGDQVPTSERRSDLLGHLSDAGRAILGFAGAMEDVPEYKMSRPFEDYTRRTQRMSEMGFTQEEKQAFNNAASDAYAYDVKSIKGLAGGSAGVALANLGRAADRMYDAQVDFASRDAAIKRQNLAMYGQQANRYEAVNRQMFQDKYTQAMMNKEAGAALARDAVTNMLNRDQYNKMYGPGSNYDKYQQLLMERTRQNVKLIGESRKNLVNQMVDDYIAGFDTETGQYTGEVAGTQDMNDMLNATPTNLSGKTAPTGTLNEKTGMIEFTNEQGEVVEVNPQTGSQRRTTSTGQTITENPITGSKTVSTSIEGEEIQRDEQGRIIPPSDPRFKYITGGMTPGEYNHKSNPLVVVDKNGQHTGMELTGGEGVFDKPAMTKIEAFAKGGDFEKLGRFVAGEMKTWNHK